MKFVSPPQRGTTCMWMWCSTPAPATRPWLKPTLNPCGSYCSVSTAIARCASAIISAVVSAGTSWIAPMCSNGAIIRCPLVYG